MYEEIERLRPLSFPGTDVFVICIPAVLAWESMFKDTIDKFYTDEICRCGFEDVPVILAKMMVDEETEENVDKQWKREEVAECRDRVGWLHCCEVSVEQPSLVTELVQWIAFAGLDERNKRRVNKSGDKRSKCTLL